MDPQDGGDGGDGDKMTQHSHQHTPHTPYTSHEPQQEAQAQTPQIPLYYPVLQTAMPDMNDCEKQKYLSPMNVRRREIRGLERLVLPVPMGAEFQEAIRLGDAYAERLNKKEEPILISDIWVRDVAHFVGVEYMSTSFDAARTYYTALCNRTKQSMQCLEEVWGQKSCENALQKLGEIMKGLDGQAQEYSNSFEIRHTFKWLEKFSDVLKKSSRKGLDEYQKGKYQRAIDMIRHGILAPKIERYVLDHIDKKMQRACGILDIDKGLAAAYLGLTQSNLPKGLWEMAGMGDIPLRPDNICYVCHPGDSPLESGFIPFWELDRRIFASMVGNMRVLREEPQTQHVALAEKKRSPEEEYVARIISAATHDHNGEIFTENIKARIKYFAQDMAYVYKLPNEEIGNICARLHEHNLPRLLRNKDKKPADVEVMAFFDDLTLEYLRKQQESNGSKEDAHGSR